MVVRQDDLQAYVPFVRSVRGTTFLTDNTTFLHLRNFSSIFSSVEVRAVTLVAPKDASVRGTALNLILPFLPSSSSSSSSGSSGGCSADVIDRVAQQLQFDVETVAAACGDAAGVITVTDSYVLGASNGTLIPLMQQLASGVEDASRQPLLVLFQSNVTLASKAWGAQWPQGGVVLRRPVAWVGSSSMPTSIDFSMEVGQVRRHGLKRTLTFSALGVCATRCRLNQQCCV
jgi:hypothetical protein